MKKALILLLLVVCGFYIFSRSSQTAKAVLSEATTAALEEPVRVPSNSVLESKNSFLPPQEAAANSNVELKLGIFEDIVLSKNDNDPRLDSNLKYLNTEEKQAFMKKYFEQKKESLNERGLIVFLIGRNISSLNDLSFIKNVAQEPECKSFEHCEKTHNDPKDEHAGVDGITLAYPQIVALKAIGNYLKSNPSAQSRAFALEIAATASNSKNSKIKSIAEDILSNSL
ncbi:MAG: hypothetical protein IPM57_04965 [Oligoflexia bacterium]|nr:hypothetical protein [Oligoflexia bacterium]